MRIGTAVPNQEYLNLVPHHFIHNLSIQKNYNVGQYEKDAVLMINKLFTKNDILVMVGGSGLYIDAIQKGLDDFPEVNAATRLSLKKQLKEKGLSFLQAQLKKLDIKSYDHIDIENPQRLIRALEICISSNKPYSSFLTDKTKNRAFKFLKIGLTADRKILYDRINKRVDLMMENGLLNEVTDLYKYRHLNALQTVGYKELFLFLEGKISIDSAVEEIKKNSRRFAKRQLTWFKKDPQIHWFDYTEKPEQILQFIEDKI
jgi:tRNA dimethylallyltransferase